MENKISKIFAGEIKIDQTEQNVIVNLALGKGIKEFDGDMKQDRLTIHIKDTNQKIVVTYNKKTKFLSVGTGQAKEMERKDEKSYHYEAQSSSMQQGVTLQDLVDLEYSKFDYKDGTLTITIPKIVPKKETKKIKVNIK